MNPLLLFGKLHTQSLVVYKHFRKATITSLIKERKKEKKAVRGGEEVEKDVGFSKKYIRRVCQRGPGHRLTTDNRQPTLHNQPNLHNQPTLHI